MRVRDTILQGSFSLEGESRRASLMLTVVVVVAVSICWIPGTMLRSLLYTVLLNLYHTSSRWVSLTFHFIDGKTEAQKSVQGHSGNERQNKD